MNRYHQILTDDEGKPTFAVIPWREYKSLGLDEALTDEELYDQGKAEEGEDLPFYVVKRLSDGAPLHAFTGSIGGLENKKTSRPGRGFRCNISLRLSVVCANLQKCA